MKKKKEEKATSELNMHRNISDLSNFPTPQKVPTFWNFGIDSIIKPCRCLVA